MIKKPINCSVVKVSCHNKKAKISTNKGVNPDKILMREAFPTEKPLCKKALAAKEPKPNAKPTAISAHPYHSWSSKATPERLTKNPTKKTPNKNKFRFIFFCDVHWYNIPRIPKKTVASNAYIIHIIKCFL